MGNKAEGIKNYPTLGHYVLAHKKELAKELGVKSDIPLWGKGGLVDLYQNKGASVKAPAKLPAQAAQPDKAVLAEIKHLSAQIKELEDQTPAGMVRRAKASIGETYDEAANAVNFAGGAAKYVTKDVAGKVLGGIGAAADFTGGLFNNAKEYWGNK